jgi:hypothetical protein
MARTSKSPKVGPPRVTFDANFEEAVDRERNSIRTAMRDIGASHERGDDSQLVHWVVPTQLGCAQRPLRHHPQYGGSGRNLAAEAAPLVSAWASRMRADGVKSILSLMHDKDLSYYLGLDLDGGNLIAFYEVHGFFVRRVPWEDPHHNKASKEQQLKSFRRVRVAAIAAYDELPKPLILQCSAGIDRSAPVAAYISLLRTSSKA